MFANLDIASPGSITDYIINQLIDADLMVANLTGPNPNVLYELAVRHAANKPIVTLAEHNTVMMTSSRSSARSSSSPNKLCSVS
jgi:hypothetical protein